MRVLVTGVAGFAGSYLAEYLLQHTDAEVHGVVHRHDRRIQHLRDGLIQHRGDLRNALWVDKLVEEIRPGHVLHLAAWSDVGGSWQQPWTTYELNIHCQLNLLEALTLHVPKARTLIVTSNEVYGLVKPSDIPIAETTCFRPNSPYGVSKVAQDMMALQYWHSHELPTVRMRSFNHIGPDQSDDFVASAFARQIAEIEVGLREPIVRVGNLEAQRDFTDVRDIVRGYWLALTHGTPGEAYNMGSGRAYSIRWLLETLLSFTSRDVQIEIDPARLRPSDVPVSICDNRKFQESTGWQPQIDLRRSLLDLLNEWRKQLGKNQSALEGVLPAS